LCCPYLHRPFLKERRDCTFGAVKGTTTHRHLTVRRVKLSYKSLFDIDTNHRILCELKACWRLAVLVDHFLIRIKKGRRGVLNQLVKGSITLYLFLSFSTSLKWKPLSIIVNDTQKTSGMGRKYDWIHRPASLIC
jgi:hypothetical protein